MNNPLFDVVLSDNEGFNRSLYHHANSEDYKTKQIYVNNNHDNRVLAVLCLGLKDFNGDTANMALP